MDPTVAHELATKGLGLILGLALVAAVVTAGVTVLLKSQSDQRAANACALKIALHLEQFAYECAVRAFEVTRGAADRRFAGLAEFQDYPEAIAWEVVDPKLASEAASFPINARIARGVVWSVPPEKKIPATYHYSRRLGWRAWQTAAALRRSRRLPRIAVEYWDFVDEILRPDAPLVLEPESPGARRQFETSWAMAWRHRSGSGGGASAATAQGPSPGGSWAE